MKLSEVVKPIEKKTSSLQEVATFTGLSYMIVYRLVKSGRIKAINRAKTGHKPIYGITPEALQEYYDQISNPSQGPKGFNK